MKNKNIFLQQKKGFTPHLFKGVGKTEFQACKKGEGFTLIELLVVIAIIGLLSTLAVTSLNSARGKARDAKRVSDVKQLSTIVEMEAINSSDGYDVFPENCNEAGELTINCGTDFGGENWTNFADPAGEGECISSVPGICAYTIGKDSNEDDYEICFYLEEGIAGVAQGLNHVGPGGIVEDGCSNSE